MSRSRLKRLYQLAVFGALLVGFGLGYGLKGTGRSGVVARTVPEGVADKQFPGCRARYVETKRAFAYGPYVRVDYADVIRRAKVVVDFRNATRGLDGQGKVWKL